MITETTPAVGDRIWTIGHADRDFDAIAAALIDHGVQTIVDVRSQPYSKWAPDFMKAALAESAASAGFGYRWMGRTLGGMPPPEPALLAAGLDELVGLCASSHVVLLCAEGDPLHCHRDELLAAALTERGYEVVHILPGGGTSPYQEPLGI
jgi:uncharacterized protein (DUF488 family)